MIHDLRIEHHNRVAQIDHLLISRFLVFYVLESKSFTLGIKITERGEFLVTGKSDYIAIESPIEQNRRHSEVLEQFLHDNNLLPTRLGITLQPTIISYVLMSPQSRVNRPSKKTFDTDMLIKADELTRKIETYIDKMDTFVTMGHLAKMVTSEMLEQIARALVSFHKPATVNYYERFGISLDSPEQLSPLQTTSNVTTKDPNHVSRYFCFKCRKVITQRVAQFCFDDKRRFGGRAYCLDCQKHFS